MPSFAMPTVNFAIRWATLVAMQLYIWTPHVVSSGLGAVLGGPESVLLQLGLQRVLVLRLPRASRMHGLEEDAERMGLPLEYFDATDGLQDETFLSRVLPLSLP